MPCYQPEEDCIVVRSGGDIATGVIQKLWRSGFCVAVLETAAPLTIRRSVALSSAVREGVWRVEDMRALLVRSADDCRAAWASGDIPVLVDPAMQSLAVLRPAVLVDAIIAKRNTGMRPDLAPVTIALGPGFTAPDDVDCVVETKRGDSLGLLITRGTALPNIGAQGLLADRIVRAPVAGRVRHVRSIGDRVAQGETLFFLDETPVPAPLGGTLRGLIAEGLSIRKGLKCADVDPRSAEEVRWQNISDKARCLGGAVLEACFAIARQKGVPLQPDVPVKAEKEPFSHCVRARSASPVQ